MLHLDKLIVVSSYDCPRPPVIPARINLAANPLQLGALPLCGIFPTQFDHGPNDWKYAENGHRISYSNRTQAKIRGQCSHRSKVPMPLTADAPAARLTLYVSVTSSWVAPRRLSCSP